VTVANRQPVFPADCAARKLNFIFICRSSSALTTRLPSGGTTLEFSKLSDMELALLGHNSYAKRHWSAEDVRTLRGCWDEYKRRGEDTITLFRPAYSGVLEFYQIDSGTITEDDVRSLEHAGAGIAADYREIVRRLRAVERIQGQSQHRAVTEPSVNNLECSQSCFSRSSLTSDFQSPCSREGIRGLP